MRKIMKITAVLLGIVILVTGFATWRYPFSAYSLYHTVDFNQDDGIVNEYLKELHQVMDYYEKHRLKDDVTSDRLAYVLQVYQIPFLTNNETMKISPDTIDEIIARLRETRNDVMELAFTQQYDEEARKYLKLMLIDFLSIEDQANHLKNATGDSRSVLQMQIRNLRTSMESNLNHLATFYQMYIESAALEKAPVK